MEHYLDQMKAEIRPKTQSGDAVDKTVSMLQSLVDDCPTPTAEDFKKMAGLQMALMNALGVNILSSMTGSRKIDRGLLQLAFKAFELSLKATAIGASIKLED